MKTKTLTTIILAAQLLAGSAYAKKEGSVGNGGGGWVTYTDATKRVEKRDIESYDLHQGEALLGLSIAAWDGKETKTQVLERILKNVATTQPGLAIGLRIVLDRIASPGFVRSSAISLTEVPGFRPETSDTAGFAQLVNWYDAGEYAPQLQKNVVLRDNARYARMNPLHQAALDLHEAAYKLGRALVDEDFPVNSVLVFVAQAFSNGPIDEFIPAAKIEASPLSYTQEPARTYVTVNEISGCPIGSKVDVKLSPLKNFATTFSRNTFSRSGEEHTPDLLPYLSGEITEKGLYTAIYSHGPFASTYETVAHALVTVCGQTLTIQVQGRYAQLTITHNDTISKSLK